MRPAVVRRMRELLAAGLSIVPIKPDGSKAPLVSWHPYQRQRPTLAELSAWVGRFRQIDAGLAIVCGRASGNVEVLDFDTLGLGPDWEAMVEDLCPGLLSRLVTVQTPRPGQHIYYRCSVIQGNQKLAQVLGLDGKPQTLIETRGLGGYAIIPPTPPASHPLNKPYQLIQGDLTQIPEITADERDLLLNCARSFHTYVNPTRIVSGYRVHAAPPAGASARPGDLFAQAVSWNDLLEPRGWTCVGAHGARRLWKRPGKAKGWSATSGLGDHDLLYVFSTNASPFEADMLYSKFGAYCILAHGGDFAAAARVLALLGYRRSRLSAVRVTS
jgi:putative DNA primase/helicase